MLIKEVSRRETLQLWRPYSRGGEAVKGIIEAENEAAAANELREKGGYFVTSLKEAKERTVLFQRPVRLKAKFLALFCRQFAIMLGTGLTLVKSLELLEAQADDPGLPASYRAFA